VGDPVCDGDGLVHGWHPGSIGSRQGNGLMAWWRSCGSVGLAQSSVISMANSGQLDLASQALSSRPSGTVPSPISWALPYSSSWNSSGADDLQRLWPWDLSGST